MPDKLTLRLLPGSFAVCRLPEGCPWAPPPDREYSFWAVTPEEKSLLCLEGDVPAEAEQVHAGLCGLRVAGTLEHSLTGVLAELTRVLAAAGVPVFAVSTWDTDYLFIPKDSFAGAREAFAGAGVAVRGAGFRPERQRP